MSTNFTNFRTINEELDFFQKRTASLKIIKDLYPDTVLSDLLVQSAILNKDPELTMEPSSKIVHGYKLFYVNFTKIVGNIKISTKPEKFLVFQYCRELDPAFIIQDYRKNMLSHGFDETFIRQVDLYLISHLKNDSDMLKQSNILRTEDEKLKKLLVLL